MLPAILKISFICSIGNRSYSSLKWKVQFCNWTLFIAATVIPKMQIKFSFMVPVSLIYKFTYILTSGKNMIITYGVQCSICTNVIWQRYTPKPTNTSDVRTVLQAIWADLPRCPINAASNTAVPQKAQACTKVAVDISNMLSELMLLASVCRVSL